MKIVILLRKVETKFVLTFKGVMKIKIVQPNSHVVNLENI